MHDGEYKVKWSYNRNNKYTVRERHGAIIVDHVLCSAMMTVLAKISDLVLVWVQGG